MCVDERGTISNEEEVEEEASAGKEEEIRHDEGDRGGIGWTEDDPLDGRLGATEAAGDVATAEKERDDCSRERGREE